MTIGNDRLATPARGFGYEGLAQEELLRRVVDANVTVLVDVRLNPISRKRGLSKTALAAAANAAGVRYVHLRGLGNPKWNRAGFATLDPEPRRTYRELLSSEVGQHNLGTLRELCESDTVGLLCFEAAERHCHREVILELLAPERF